MSKWKERTPMELYAVYIQSQCINLPPPIRQISQIEAEVTHFITFCH